MTSSQSEIEEYKRLIIDRIQEADLYGSPVEDVEGVYGDVIMWMKFGAGFDIAMGSSLREKCDSAPLAIAAFVECTGKYFPLGMSSFLSNDDVVDIINISGVRDSCLDWSFYEWMKFSALLVWPSIRSVWSGLYDEFSSLFRCMRLDVDVVRESSQLEGKLTFRFNAHYIISRHYAVKEWKALRVFTLEDIANKLIPTVLFVFASLKLDFSCSKSEQEYLDTHVQAVPRIFVAKCEAFRIHKCSGQRPYCYCGCGVYHHVCDKAGAVMTSLTGRIRRV